MDIGMAAYIMQTGVFQVLIIAAPVLIIGISVGLIISIFQATTSIQEQTLTFVPKIFITIIVILITANFMLSQLITFSNQLFDLMLKISRPG